MRVLWYNQSMKNEVSAAELVAENTTLRSKVLELETLVKFYEEQFRLAKHRQFGASSEKSEYDQISLFNEAEATADVNVPEPELTEIKRHFRKSKRLTNDRLPEDLPIEVVEHDIPAEEQECPECGGKLHVMGQTKRRELVIVPAHVKIREHIRKVYACRDCEKDECGVPILKAPVDEAVIKGSFASPEAIAHIMTQKFVMGVPLYRQEQDWNRQGIMLSRQTMSNWLIKATEDWLEPIYETLKEILCNQEVLHADETTLQVLKEPGKTAQSQSYMWLYRTSGNTDHPIVLYDYQPDRKGKRPAEFLKEFKGYLHTDGYEVYHGLKSDITVVGCWSHCRRRFDEALKIIPEKDRIGTEAMHGKHFCDRLFALERKFLEIPADDNFKLRYAARIEQSKPVMDEFFEWAKKIYDKTLPKIPLGRALKYAIDQKPWLERVLMDGRLEISNNRAERSIKPFVIDRKNFLFANTPRGAKASAVMFSLIETAKENGLNPFKYLTYIFNNAPNWDIRNNINMMEFLIPHLLSGSLKADLSG